MWKKTFVRGRIPENVEEFLRRWEENFFKWMVSSDKWKKTLRLWINFGRQNSLFFKKIGEKERKNQEKPEKKWKFLKKGAKNKPPFKKRLWKRNDCG